MLVVADAGQLEWRIPVELSRDETALHELLQGFDVHSNNEKELELPSRLIAKIFLFRVIFRGTGWAFARDNDFKHVSEDPDYWDTRIERFFQKYNGLDGLHRRWKEEVELTGKLTGITGRTWYFEKRPRGKAGNLAYSINDITNWPVQGTGNDLIAIARVSMKNRLTKYKIPSIMVSTVHDSIINDTPEKYVQDVHDIYHEVFRDIPKNVKKLFGYEMVVPFPCECKKGMNLKDMEKMD